MHGNQVETTEVEEQSASLADRAFGGLLWQFSGAGGKGILQIGFLAVLARLITPEEFGVVGAAMIVIGLSSLFSQFGVGPALVHLPNLGDAHIRVGFWLMLVLGVATATGVWFAAPYVSEFFRMPELEAVLLVLSLVFILRVFGVIAESLLQRELEFSRLASVDVVSYGLGYGLVGTVMGVLGYGYWALVGAHIGQTAVKAGFLLALRPHPVHPSFDASAARDLIRYGGGQTLAKFGNYAAGQGDNLIVGRLLGASSLGLYGRAYQLLVTPAQLVGRVLDRVLFPAMATIQKDRERLARTYRRGVAAVGIVSLPLSGMIFVLAPEIVDVLLGSQWDAAVPLLQIFSVGLLFRTSYKVSDSLVRATGWVYRRAWRQWIYALLIFASASIGSAWGLPGVTLGVLFAICANFFLMAHLSLKITGLSVAGYVAAHRAGALLAVVSTTVTVAVAWYLRLLELPSLVIVVVALLVCTLVTRNILFKRWHSLFLGVDGMWIVELAGRNLPYRVLTWLLPAGVGPRAA